MNPQLKKNLSSSHYWTRTLYVILFLWIAGFACMLASFVAVIQILISLIAGQPNNRLIKFGGGLSQFLYSIGLFVTHNTEVKPFPFADWPQDYQPEECSQNACATDAIKEPSKTNTKDEGQDSDKGEAKESASCSRSSEETCSAETCSTDDVQPSEEATDESLTDSGPEFEKPEVEEKAKIDPLIKSDSYKAETDDSDSQENTPDLNEKDSTDSDKK